MVVERISHGVERRIRRLRTKIRNARPSIYIVKKQFRDQPIIGCEIGVFRGKHSEQMLTTLPNLTRLYLVDPYDMYEGYEDFENPSTVLLESAERDAHNRLVPYSDRVIWIKEKFDKKHIPESLDFVYIDGQHTYDAVMHDIKHSEQLIKPGGIIAGHDYYPVGHYLNDRFGVGKAVRDYFGTNHHWELNDWWVEVPETR